MKIIQKWSFFQTNSVYYAKQKWVLTTMIYEKINYLEVLDCCRRYIQHQYFLISLIQYCVGGFERIHIFSTRSKSDWSDKCDSNSDEIFIYYLDYSCTLARVSRNPVFTLKLFVFFTVWWFTSNFWWKIIPEKFISLLPFSFGENACRKNVIRGPVFVFPKFGSKSFTMDAIKEKYCQNLLYY